MGENYWDSRFKAGKVWGDEPSGTAPIASEYFKRFNKNKILVIGSGYGRNTNYFYDNGYIVEGIEYAKDGIDIARQDNPNIEYFHGSAFDMPLTSTKYSAVYCYNVIHLFMEPQRERLISICSNVLEDGGLLFFSAFSDEDIDYGIGDELETNTFEMKKDKPVHYYGRDELIDSFASYKFLEDGVYTEVVSNKECRLRYIVAQYLSSAELP
jgi:SAM-dependent methyltransferase